MKIITSKYLIIGAGLSGLTSANELLKIGETDFKILEARNRIGGRVYTKNKIDLGATWFHTHHSKVLELVDKLGVPKFHQYTTGRNILVYSTMAPERYFESDPNTPAAYRIGGGSIALVKALAQPVRKQLVLNAGVVRIEETETGIQATTENAIYEAEKIIVAVPPQIAKRIDYQGQLSEDMLEYMGNTHTWMSNAMKVGLTFKTPFWREKDFSGTMIGQVGAVTELYDHSDMEDQNYALMGFINEGLRDTSSENRKDRILTYLEKYLGREVRQYTSYEELDWAADRNTCCGKIKSIYMSPEYTRERYNQSYLNNKVIFSSAETSDIHGGYMDGAVISGIRAVDQLLETKL